MFLGVVLIFASNSDRVLRDTIFQPSLRQDQTPSPFELAGNRPSHLKRGPALGPNWGHGALLHRGAVHGFQARLEGAGQSKNILIFSAHLLFVTKLKTRAPSADKEAEFQASASNSAVSGSCRPRAMGSLQSAVVVWLTSRS